MLKSAKFALVSSFLALFFISSTVCFAQNDGSAATGGPIVVVVSFDGFPARALQDPRLPMPTLRMLEENGAHADAMQPVNPTITWPNHTALITGVNASVHHVVANGLITFPPYGVQPQVLPWVPKNKLVHAETLYDALAKKHMTTGQVDWVAIYAAKHVRWQFAEHPNANNPIAQDLIRQHLITTDQVATFDENGSPAWHDEIWTDAAIDILTHHTPNLLLFHLLQTDTIQHKYGPLTPAAYAAYAYADSCLARLVNAASTAGLLKRITFILVSDHGFASYDHIILPNVGLIQQGYLTKQNGVYRGKVWVVSDDGSALLFIHDAADHAALLTKLKTYLQGVPGIVIYTDAEAQQFGVPALGSTDQAPDLFLVAKPSYAIFDDTNGPLVEEIHPARGTHGYLNTDPDMEALFIASGARIRPGVDLGNITNLQVAPTIAKILGVSLPAAKQPPLAEALR